MWSVVVDQAKGGARWACELYLARTAGPPEALDLAERVEAIEKDLGLA